MTLPVSRLVNVDVNLTPALAQAPNFNTCLILGTSNVIDVTTRMKEYGSLNEVATDFGTDSEEYVAAKAWFGQTPRPLTLEIGRWANVASSGQLFGGPLSLAEQNIATWAAINNGGFDIIIDGVGPTEIGNLDFTAAGNLNAVAAVIESGFPGGTTNVVWDAANSRFVFTNVSTGVTSTLSFATAPNTGTDISGMLKMLASSNGAYVADGVDAQTALDTVVIFDNKFSSQWYGLNIPSATDDDHMAVGAYIESDEIKHIYGVNSSDVAILSAASTTDIAYRLKAAGYNRTMCQYTSQENSGVVSALARILTTNWNGTNTAISLMYKSEPGIVPENLTVDQAAVLDSKNCNVFTTYNNGTSIIQTGICSSGQFADTVIGCDWLGSFIQNNLFNVLFGASTKIPQTDSGNHILATSIESSCDQAVQNGLLAPGIWNSAGFGTLTPGQYLPKGYYVYQPPISTQSPADRAARKSVPFQVAVKLAGAINTVDVLVNVNS